MIAVIFLLQLFRLRRLERQEFGHIGRHVFVDLREEIDVMRVKRVVEIEDPVGDMGKFFAGRQAVELFHGRLMTWRAGEENGFISPLIRVPMDCRPRAC
ncbi:hypothetical protein ABIA23_004042 [Sinorhizobium fredii]